MVLGPFYPTLDRKMVIDFSRPFSPHFRAVVVPIEKNANMWYISQPYTDVVWIIALICIPIYIPVMALAYYFYDGSVDMERVSQFVIRNALTEHYDVPDDKLLFQKILITTYLVFIFVMVQGYCGSLTAMLSKPYFAPPMKTLEELLHQDEIPFVVEVGTVTEHYMRTSKEGTTMKLLHEKAGTPPMLNLKEKAGYGCYSYKAKMTGQEQVASFCSLNYVWPMIAHDFSMTGKCNFYLMDEKVLDYPVGAAFQVSTIAKI